MNINQPVDKLDGVGEALNRRLLKLGIATVGDLLLHYPRRYDDFSNVTKIAKAQPGTVTLRGEITSVNVRRTRKGGSLTEALISDDSGSVQAIWFNQPYLAKQLPKNEPVYIAGDLAYRYQRFALQNPAVEPVSTFPRDTARIVPVYPETARLSSKQLRRLLMQALSSDMPETIPEKVRKKYRLIAKDKAIRQIHFPDSQNLLEAARYRLSFEELYLLMLRAEMLKQDISALEAPSIDFDERATRQFIDKLPFKLTDDQRKAAWQILQDMQRSRPMNRLLQGEVGSGKTVVAALAALQVARAGLQTVFLAPTEILAQQHYDTLVELLEPQGVGTALLVGSQTSDERQRIRESIKSSDIGVVVGTHALLQPDVEFADVGLTVIDEQHRFGVKQRQHLRSLGKETVHVLSMSATPIPRSLALTVYGDLDVTSIKQLPSERKPTKTEVVSGDQAVYRRIYTMLESGSKAFVVCPLIDDSAALDTTSVTEEVTKLRRLWPNATIAGLNGRMSAEEKSAAMDGFKNGDTNVLVATTVVEVGVDVSDADIMLVEGAERFGLATLHQLRGRVGRGKQQAFCFLRASKRNQAVHRLQLMERYNDGFTLAEKDLELRGAGQLYGLKQHGLLDLKLASFSDHRLIKQAREASMETGRIERYPALLAAVKRLKTSSGIDVESS